MFGRYTEKARRVIFFARYEASQFGSPYIETEHLLLGLLREYKTLTQRFLRGGPTQVEEIRQQIESATMVREKISTSVDLPLSNECKRVLAYAAEEAERLSHQHLGSEHLLLGLLREEKSFAAQILNERGVRLASVREELGRSEHREEPASSSKEGGMLADFATFLTQQANAGQLLPCIGREKEIAQVMQILGRSGKNNAVLVGQPGVGKRTIAEAVAQRVTGHVSPAFLADKFFSALDLATVVTAAQHSARSKEYLGAATAELLRWGANTIFIFDELHALLAAGSSGGLQEITLLLKSALIEGKVRCIALATPQEYDAAQTNARWLERCFLAVQIWPPNEEETITILRGIKERFEKFHSVQYTEEALAAAVGYSHRLVKNRNLPDKAIDLIDDAGAYVKMKHEKTVLPTEVIEAARSVKLLMQRKENAIANHEFEKARFYSDEEKRQRDLLRSLEVKHNLTEKLTGTVTAEHIEEVLARWTGIRVGSVRDAAAAANGAEEPKEAKSLPRKKVKKKKSP